MAQTEYSYYYRNRIFPNTDKFIMNFPVCSYSYNTGIQDHQSEDVYYKIDLIHHICYVSHGTGKDEQAVKIPLSLINLFIKAVMPILFAKDTSKDPVDRNLPFETAWIFGKEFSWNYSTRVSLLHYILSESFENLIRIINETRIDRGS